MEGKSGGKPNRMELVFIGTNAAVARRKAPLLFCILLLLYLVVFSVAR